MEKKDAKTRTSITIDPAVLQAARVHCESANISVSSFIETSLSEKLNLPAVAESVADVTPTNV